MYISQVKIKGFRNFKYAVINLNPKSLIIGPNDVGKSNLIYALRIVLDKSLSESSLEPSDSDFYVKEDTNEMLITVKFSDIQKDPQKDECIFSRLGKHISDNNELFIRYKAWRDRVGGKKDYTFFIAESEENLEKNDPIDCRYYTKYLNLEYVHSNRDLMNYLKKEKSKILETARSRRNDETTKQDTIVESNIKNKLEEVNTEINKLSYIKSSTCCFNAELKLLNQCETESIEFNSGSIDTNKYINNLDLVSKFGDKTVNLGGDGKANQIFLTMWATKNNPDIPEYVEEIKIYCIEEPEAHLHPHKQRNLAKYLTDRFNSQIILTTHSPQIACEFSPNSMVKLYDCSKGSLASQNGCSSIIQETFDNFGYRLNIIPAEAFFSDLIFLVEGVSEVLFYKALAKVLNISLDSLNISILSVEGIGFQTYIDIFSKLNVRIVVRTDNDIVQMKQSKADKEQGILPKYRLSGFERAIKINNVLNQDKINNIDNLKNIPDKDSIPDEIITYTSQLRQIFEKNNIFLSKKDFETDLAQTELKDELIEFYELPEESSEVDIVKKMQEKKGINIYEFLENYKDSLVKLINSDMAKPLTKCQEILFNESVLECLTQL